MFVPSVGISLATTTPAKVETGTPYMLYKDACNFKSNQKNPGTIKSSNLCTEIVEYTAPDEVHPSIPSIRQPFRRFRPYGGPSIRGSFCQLFNNRIFQGYLRCSFSYRFGAVRCG